MTEAETMERAKFVAGRLAANIRNRDALCSGGNGLCSYGDIDRKHAAEQNAVECIEDACRPPRGGLEKANRGTRQEDEE
ncbi:hypothetical protein DWF04_015315 [Cereibacter sphaeroides f. sp. denitrificans]